jgi:hypothetical protein
MTYYEAMLIHIPVLLKQVGYDQTNYLIIQKGKELLKSNTTKAQELAMAWLQSTRGRNYQDIEAAIAVLKIAWARAD